MEFRKSLPSDSDSILNIIKQAQAYFKKQGINQWQNGYPNQETIRRDMEKQYGYVLTREGDVVATVAVSFDGEETYRQIFDGEWLSDGEYAVIHRIAVAEHWKGCGLSSEIIRQVEKICVGKGVRSMKIDTHSDNFSMQRLLSKNGFRYCGKIRLLDGNPRIAFEKLLSE